MATHPWGAVAVLAAAQHGVLSRAQAADIGLTERQLRTLVNNGWLDRPHPGVLRVTATPDSWRQRLQAATLAAGGTVASHRAAARLHGLDGFLRATSIEVSVERPRHPRLEGVNVHRVARLEPVDLTTVAGIPVTSIARTLSDLGSMATDDDVERALDDALRRGVSSRWVTDTHERVLRPGPSGTGSLARVLSLSDRAGAVPESWRERVTQRILSHPELRPLAVQHEIRDLAGRVIARPDLAVVDAKLGIEYHSDQWHYGPRRGRRDRRRDLAAARLGWELLYLDASDHPRPAAAVEAVLDVVRARRRAIG
jgi:hypothetical protein